MKYVIFVSFKNKRNTVFIKNRVSSHEGGKSSERVSFEIYSNISNFVFSLESDTPLYLIFDHDFAWKHKIPFPGVKILLIHLEILQIDHF